MNPSARIRRLPRELVDKIAAGEVVERPASVVKELIENATDAEASRLEVTLQEGGKRVIRVADDGVGMSPADLDLAFESHATSKIAEPEELFEIHTLGFRGEALASIAAVSRCRIVSRESGSDEAASVECAAGRVGNVRACGAPEGTIVEVRDLFFNTPARLKFLRSTATELRHAVEAVTRLALPHPKLGVNVIHNRKSVLRLDPCESQRGRLAAIFGDELSSRLLSVHSESSALAITGMVSPPGEGLPSAMHYVFLNGRYIRDRAIRRAVAEAYRARLAHGRFPAVFLNLQIDPRRVDVNVHPTKIEVRFRDSGAVFAQVLTALEKTLSSAGVAMGGLMPGRRHDAGTRTSPAAARRDGARRAMAEFFGRSTGSERHEPAWTASRPHSAKEHAPASMPPQEPAAAPLTSRGLCQIHDTYIVEEVEDGFLLIDQHALHERILYEELRERVARAAVPRQRLLVPEIVDLRPEDFLLAMEIKDELRKMGLEIEPFGEKTIAVQAVPHLAAAVNPSDLLQEILRDAKDSAPRELTARREELLRVIACKSAIKAGERLTHHQIGALLEQRTRTGPEPVCPHGRPTTLKFDLRDLQRQFRRK